MQKFGRGVVKLRVPILIVSVLLLIPSIFGFVSTRINYDILSYLPSDIETMKGQDIMLDEFGKGGFSLVMLDGMDDKDVEKVKEKIEKVDHVCDVLWYDTLADVSLPKEVLPDDIYDFFNTDNSTMMAVFFDEATSADGSLEAVKEIRSIAGEQCFVSGMSSVVEDIKDLTMQEAPMYVVIAVILTSIILALTMDSFLIPLFFMLSVGMAIIYNMGTNFIQGEISFITEALAAVLQLAVTIDYSIFLWHSYNEQRAIYPDKCEAMAHAISATLTSVVGSSITTIAGFLALCFMSFTLGRDLGIVMAKGVLLGVLSCVTVLPSLILLLDKPLQKTRHRSILPKMDGLAKGVTKVFPLFLALFVVLAPVFYFAYDKTNDEVYYDMGQCLPEDMEYVIANSKLSEEFDIASTHMLLVDASLPSKQVRSMISDMEQVDGVKYVLGLESVVGAGVPEEILPDSVRSILKSDKWELLLINSEYKVASDEVNAQIDSLNAILKKYDPTGMLIGEAPCMKDMIETTDHDFKVVNAVSILAIFLIILLVERSISLPFLLIAVIELAIFINLGLPHFLGQSLPFIAPICISTIQLGATVDYAILMTTRYKAERLAGKEKRPAVITALSTSIPSIIVSGMGLFAATFGVAIYSDIDIISSMCMLMARGAIVSMLCVILILPALLLLCDRLVCATTLGMRHCNHSRKHAEKQDASAR